MRQLKEGSEPVCSNVGSDLLATHTSPLETKRRTNHQRVFLQFQLLGQDSNLEPSG
jgi:hypothetical protein